MVAFKDSDPAQAQKRQHPFDGSPLRAVLSNAVFASKAALATLTKNGGNAFAAKRIQCNGILTGWMDTPGESVTQEEFHGVGEDGLAKAEAAQPMGQLVKLDQLAGLVSYLLSVGK